MDFSPLFTFFLMASSETLEDDADLLQRFSEEGDRIAFETLYHRHKRWVYLVCYRFCRSPERAVELTQDVFLRCMEKAASFHGGNFRGWLKVLAVNVCLDEARREKTRKENPLEERTGKLHNLETQEREIENRERKERVAAVLSQLVYQQKIALIMKYFFDLSYEEIQQRTGFTEKEVKSYIQNGRRNFEILWEGVSQAATPRERPAGRIEEA